MIFELNMNNDGYEFLVVCEESYIEQKENEICQTGCNLMGKELEVSYFAYLSRYSCVPMFKKTIFKIY